MAIHCKKIAIEYSDVKFANLQVHKEKDGKGLSMQNSSSWAAARQSSTYKTSVKKRTTLMLSKHWRQTQWLLHVLL